ncbi:MAG: insulinase family protein [Candidatus Paracaedimonas acanthamoebae]|uniref:Insulinase family protein n=1 Tax=Candidatus Paracaedimonas acanthamoebae TaxID=244581 RepID=A0A8J7PHN4_9PROT|nr:insulinase family protein [Candidatus Paracaedimonas acanthamoebae]
MTIRTTILPNGLRVVTDTIETVETIALGVWVKVGSRHETSEMNGISHMLEHMNFRGTKRHTAREIAEKIEAVGGHLNAYTSREHTGYYARILKQDLSLAIDLLSDILQFSIFNIEEFEREKTVVLQEISQAHDTPDDIIFDLFQETAFPAQPLGYPIIGRPEIIKSFKLEDLKNHIEAQYVSSNMVIAAAGKIEHERFVDLVSHHFTNAINAKPKDAVLCEYKGGDLRVTRDLEQVHLVLGFPSVRIGHEDYYATSLLATILGGGMSSRLFQEVREKRGLVYEIQSFINGFSDHGIFGIYASANPHEAKDLLPIVCEELLAFPLTMTQKELDRAKAQLKASMMMALESTAARCEQLVQQTLVYGRPLETTEILNFIDRVELEKAKIIASSIFSQPITFSAIGPTKVLENYESLTRRLGTLPR